MSSLSDTIVTRFKSPTSHVTLYLLAGAVSLGTYNYFNSRRETLHSNNTRAVPSPRETVLPRLSRNEIDVLPYPPDALPGARDVESPYGHIRVYEWGPEDGPRVLFIHGISTPSIALGRLAHKLADNGCRVMLFDLFGRGYSSAPDPSIHPYDSTLYTSQILLTLSSSPVPWPSFSLIGYSLGGAIAADFTSYFPHLITSLFLIAPGGLIRTNHITWKSRLLYSTSGLIPESLIQRLVAKRLWTGPQSARTVEPEPDASLLSSSTNEVDEEKTGGLRSQAVYLSGNQVLLPGNPESTIGNVVDWQIRCHAGFVPAFISSIRFAPIHAQHHRWRIVGEYLARAAAGADVATRDTTSNSKRGTVLNEVHLVLGEKDPIILAEEVEHDVKEILGAQYVRVKIFKGVGHEVGIEKADDIAQLVADVLAL